LKEELEIKNLKIKKNEVEEVSEGEEMGISFVDFNDL